MTASTKLTREEAIATYLEDKSIKVADIAAAAGVSPQRFYQWLAAAGVEPNRRLGDRRQRPRYTSRLEVEWTAEGIKRLRAHMGLTQRGLAEELGVRQQTISEWETGMYRPRRSMSKYLAIIAERAGFVYRPGSQNTPESDEP
jgi:transcriptional regulator with XRE-family HTH domain